ncbi:MAG: aminomethyl-transferring glycine dehydrogenase, partial [Phycisphaeraceae bacterium]
ADLSQMLRAIGVDSVDQLIEQTVPANIRLTTPLQLPGALGEFDALRRLESIALKNQIHRSYIGCGYHNTATPAVLRRNILENPGWYTQYTPYQAEISQGRLEALLNFQTMICDLTDLPVANASLLDEATAAAEAMAMCVAAAKGTSGGVLIADHCHPQNIAVCQTRAWSMNIDLQVVNIESPDFNAQKLPGVAGVIVQYPTTDGRVIDYTQLAEQVHAAGGLLVMIADPLALALLKSPGEIGADIAVGSTQRFGCPMGAGGPHAAYMACRADLVRKMPGRLVGVSRDAQGNPALRLSIQTREQHIRRDKATSNICTAQALPAIIASMFAVYHGPAGLQQIATRAFAFTQTLAAGLKRLGYTLDDAVRFDTITLQLDKDDASQIIGSALQRRMNLRDYGDGRIGVTLDETTTRGDLSDLLDIFARGRPVDFTIDELADGVSIDLPQGASRTTAYLSHPVFNRYHTEHEMLRYLTRLQARDLSLTTSMIPLGSCTMKLNPAAAMLPITWPQFAQIHPFAPVDQMRGYHEMFTQLESWLAAITGFDAISLQPNAGSQGEYAGLLAIRRYHESRTPGSGTQRDVCLIPTSAHGTNPASAVIAGFRVVAVGCRDNGDIDLDDLRAKADEHADHLAAFMITYPSTHGVFENTIIDACRIIHDRGGQVYMDGANMNAQVGLTSPGSIGADVCHLNLHKTFCIPHGGGGPGMGPIGVKAHLKPFLPGDPMSNVGCRMSNVKTDATHSTSDIPHPTSHIGAVSAAPFGSASVLAISWMYIQMMGPEGLRRASEHAILNANYMAARLRDKYQILYTNFRGRCAHEFIVDCRPLADAAHVTVEDIAKRLMDYGFHAPTMSWPVGGTLMIEPTESESRAELDRLCDALLQIHDEAQQIQSGQIDAHDNPLKNAPHTQLAVTADDWQHPYSRQTAAFPAAWLKVHKFWPPVARIDNPFGDRHLVCTCPSVEDF